MNRYHSLPTTATGLLALVFAVGVADARAQHGGGAPHVPSAPPGQSQGVHPAPPPQSHGAQAKPDPKGPPATAGHSAVAHGQPTVSALLTQNTQLSTRLAGLLPAGTNLTTASAGFKNLGQFVAAVHVAHNLDIPFDTLKAKMTGPGAESLGNAIKELSPSTNAKAAQHEAEDEAKTDLTTATPPASGATSSVRSGKS